MAIDIWLSRLEMVNVDGTFPKKNQALLKQGPWEISKIFPL